MLFTLYLTLSAIALCSVSAAPSSNALPLGKESRGLLKRQQLVPLCNQPANSTLSETAVARDWALLGET